jgi:dihydropteroate synthase
LYSIALPDGRTLRLGERPLVMGIINVTPDSFGEAAHLVRGGIVDAAAALERALRMEADGADIIDVGGESTRPGADPVSADDELARVVPVIRALAGRLKIPVSVDTYKAAVATAALESGASIINDVSGLTYDPALAPAAAKGRAALIVMHTRGRSKAMYQEARYTDVTREVAEELRQSLEIATSAGVILEQIVVDPGIGFAKRSLDSYGVLAGLAEIAHTLDRPVLAGPSRKSFLREALGGRPAPERDWGTAAAVTAAVLAGAHIVRVHAVAEMAQVVRVAEEIRRAGEPGAGA